ncbi:MAG: hypothetical protein QOD62_3329, partial [Actinomycetota bacterium]|nr:hypothetical protein [Actinomycetota bacterium]
PTPAPRSSRSQPAVLSPRSRWGELPTREGPDPEVRHLGMVPVGIDPNKLIVGGDLADHQLELPPDRHAGDLPQTA